MNELQTESGGGGVRLVWNFVAIVVFFLKTKEEPFS